MAFTVWTSGTQLAIVETKSSPQQSWRDKVRRKESQGSTKTVSDSLGLVDFPVRQADFIGRLRDGVAWSNIFMARLTVDQTLG